MIARGFTGAVALAWHPSGIDSLEVQRSRMGQGGKGPKRPLVSVAQ